MAFVLARKIDEEFWINDDVRIKLVDVRGRTARLMIECPDEVVVQRGEKRDPDRGFSRPTIPITQRIIDGCTETIVNQAR